LSIIIKLLVANSRHTDEDNIFAFIIDVDAPERSTAVTRESRTDNKNTKSSTLGQTFSNPKNSPIDSCIAKDQNRLHPLSTGDEQDDYSKLKTNICQINSETGDRSSSGVARIDDCHLPDPASSRDQSMPCGTGESRSDRDVSCGILNRIMVDMRGSQQVVLKPGDFEIILCVDNQEVYGG